MILKNSKGLEKEFKIIMEVESDKSNYLVYKDENNNNLYAGKLVKDELKVLDLNEYDMLNDLLEKIKD